MLQHDESDPHYGWINDGPLNEFVARAGADGPSLLVLTSRFPFPEVTREHPEAARACELPLLTDDEGADLLAHCGLEGGREKLRGYSHQFGGHPLALRLFAGACLAQPFDEPETVSRHLLAAGAEAGEEDAHRRQFRKLLLWLQKKLPAEKRRLLQLVALFREPVPTATLAALATGLDAMQADFADCDAAHLRFLLDALVRDHLLQREEAPSSDTARWAAHPIVREVFRGEALASGDSVAGQFAEIVAGKGIRATPKSVGDLQPILEAIDVLVDALDFEAAHELFSGRLQHGHVFLSIPAPNDGLMCALRFIEPEERRLKLDRSLGSDIVQYYLAVVADFRQLLGQMKGVEQFHADAIEFWRGNNVLAFGFHSLMLASAQILSGSLERAHKSASQASICFEPDFGCHFLPEGMRDLKGILNQWKRPSNAEHLAFAYRAYAALLMGRLCEACKDFTWADKIAPRRDDDSDPELYLSRCLMWCRGKRLLVQGGGLRLLVEACRAVCQSHGLNAEMARFDLLLGEQDFVDGFLDRATSRVRGALMVFREAHQNQDLPDALLAQARLRGSIEDCEEALRLAARSGFALKQCDALNLRARLRREAGQPTAAAKDARDALEISERCGYYWGRHEALRQLRDAAHALGHRADAQHWDEAEKSLAAKMQPEIEEALRINREHDAEMERLYGNRP